MAELKVANYTGFEAMLQGVMQGNISPKRSLTTDAVFGLTAFNAAAAGSTAEVSDVSFNFSM